MEYIKKYFINEWTGKKWLKKELLDGESVVVIEEGDKDSNDKLDKSYTEYRNVNGELVDVASIIYNNVMTTIDPKIKEIKQNILLLFKILFQDYKTIMTPNSIIFTSSQGNVMIDNENFDIF